MNKEILRYQRLRYESEHWAVMCRCALRWLVNLNSGLQTRLVSVFGRLIQQELDYIANRSRVSSAHNTSRASVTPWPWNLG